MCPPASKFQFFFWTFIRFCVFLQTNTDEHDKDGMYDDELLGGEEDFLDDDEDLLDDDEKEDDDLYDDDVDLLNDDGDIYNQGLSESETNAFDVLDEDDWK